MNIIDIEIMKDLKIIINTIKSFFLDSDILKKSLLYLSNNDTLNLIYGNTLNKINIYCVNDIHNFDLLCFKIKELNDNTDFKVNFVTFNYSKNKYKNNDKLYIYYRNNKNKHFQIIINFFKNIYCLKELQLKYINDNNDILNNIKNIFYFINNNSLYKFNESKDSLIKFENYSNILDNNYFDCSIFNNEPYVILEVIYYYILTSLDIFKNIIIEFINMFNESNNVFKEMIDNLFNLNELAYLNIILKFLNFIWKESLQTYYFEFIEKFGNINIILFKTSEIKTYDYNIEDIESYISILLFNKNKLLTNNYTDYIKKNVLDNKNDILLIEDNLTIYRKLKKYNNFLINLEDHKEIDIDLGSINNFYQIISILLYCDTNTETNIESLKFGYIFKKYSNLKKTEFEKIFDFYNKVLKSLKLENLNIKNNDYFYEMIKFNKIFIKIEYELYDNIQNIKKKYNTKEDNIDIFDYQDAFVLVYELFYLNKIKLNNYILIKITFKEYLNAVISNIRANKLLENTKIDITNLLTNDNLTSNLVNNNNLLNSDRTIKYQKNKNEYIKLKEIYNIISNNYFNINLFQTKEVNQEFIDIVESIYLINHINIVSETDSETDSAELYLENVKAI